MALARCNIAAAQQEFWAACKKGDMNTIRICINDGVLIDYTGKPYGMPNRIQK